MHQIIKGSDMNFQGAHTHPCPKMLQSQADQLPIVNEGVPIDATLVKVNLGFKS